MYEKPRKNTFGHAATILDGQTRGSKLYYRKASDFLFLKMYKPLKTCLIKKSYDGFSESIYIWPKPNFSEKKMRTMIINMFFDVF